MKVLIIDTECGQGVSFGMDCVEAGHDVRLWINPFPDGSPRTAGDGLVPKVKDYHSSLKWADLIMVTGNGMLMKERDKLIEQGFPIFGAGSMGCKLEIDRGFAMKMLERLGVEMIPYHEFNNLNEAEAFLKKNGGMYVVKTLGDEEDKSLTHVPSHADYADEEMINIFEKWRKEGKMKGKVMLQEFLPGIEIGASCYFGPGGWSKHINLNFEHKKLCSHNFGPNTGEMGTVVQYVTESKIFDTFMKPVTEYLLATNYVGDFAVNCIVNEKDGSLGFLEYTTRCGWPHQHLIQELHKGDPVNWMLDLIEGKDTLEVYPDACVGLVMAHPNFPYTSHRNIKAEGVPVLGLNEKNMKHIHFAEMRLGKVNRYETAGEYPLVISEKAPTVMEAAKKAYDIAEYIGLPNKIVRDDVGEKLKDKLPKLHKFGIAKEVKYE